MSADQVKVFAGIMAKRHPSAFGVMVPLARGIREQLYKESPKVPRAVINRFLKERCKSAEYLAACAVPGAARINLDGTVQEPVSESHRGFSEDRLGKAVQA